MGNPLAAQEVGESLASAVSNGPIHAGNSIQWV